MYFSLLGCHKEFIEMQFKNVVILKLCKLSIGT